MSYTPKVQPASPVIPFSRPYVSGDELAHLQTAIRSGHLRGGGPFAAKCQRWIEKHTGAGRALLTTSCTAALEIAAIVAEIQPGTEVIVPSFAFASTANAFALRGATIVFVDIRPDTLNIDEQLVAEAVRRRTRAIVPVHYAGVSSEMSALMDIGRSRKVLVIEDAAQCFLGKYRGAAVGSIGDFCAFSFHESKNVTGGEAGALAINRPELMDRAEIIQNKGTSRTLEGGDRYTWRDLGSSYVPSELTTAFLFAQLEQSRTITERRLAIWNQYQQFFSALEAESGGRFRVPVIPPGIDHNAAIYHLVFEGSTLRERFIAEMAKAGIEVTAHFPPLHESPAGRKYGRVHGEMRNTVSLSGRIARLPLWPGMERHIDTVTETARRVIASF